MRKPTSWKQVLLGVIGISILKALRAKSRTAVKSALIQAGRLEMPWWAG